MPNNTKPLTLPSGATCTIHAPSRFTDMEAGYPPQSLTRQNPKVIVEDRSLTKAEIDYLVTVQKVKLLRCVSPLRLKDGSAARLVDKPFWELKPGELCLEDLSQADGQMLSDEIDALRQEAAAQVETFPTDVAAPEAGAAHPGPNGTPLPVFAESACAVISG